MIFISSIVPLNEIPTSKEEICKSDWFLFSAMIKEKIIKKMMDLMAYTTSYVSIHIFIHRIYITISCQIITIIGVFYITQCKAQLNYLAREK